MMSEIREIGWFLVLFITLPNMELVIRAIDAGTATAPTDFAPLFAFPLFSTDSFIGCVGCEEVPELKKI